MSRTGLRWLCLSLVLCLGGCASAVLGGAGRSNPAMNPAAASDAAISAEINASYVRDALIDAFDVRVNTVRGTVTLHGRVDSERAERRAVELAQSVRGVNRVVSELIVDAR